MAETSDRSHEEASEPGPRETELLWHYLDRINAGEDVDPEEILREYPDVGPELVAQLEAFVRLAGTPKSDEPLGTLGDFTLRREIGRGGMGIVYDAWQNSVNRRVALKVLPVGAAADRRAFARFMREAQAAGQLSHPNVAAVHALGIDAETPYYAMEFIEGETLAEVRKRIEANSPGADSPFGPPGEQDYSVRIARAFAEVADGLQHAHANKITHRDIKPSNLILDRQGRIRILDFGLAQLEGQESLTLSGDLVGTPLYMSPEQASHEKRTVDRRTDIYSLGATIFETLTLHPPFKGETHNDTLSQIVEREPKPPRKINPGIPADLETIVLKCLRKSPADRYGTADALAQDLRRFVRGDPVEARPEASFDRFVRRWWPHRWRLLTAIGALLLVVVAGILLQKTRLAEREKARVEYAEIMERAALMLQRQDLLASEHAGNVDLLEPKISNFIKYSMPGVYSQFELTPTGEIETELERAIQNVPKQPEAYYYLAKARILLGQGAESALALLNSALEVDETFVPARFVRGEILRHDAAENDAPMPVNLREEAPPQTTPDDWRRSWLEAHRALRRRDWPAAAAAFDRLNVTKKPLYLGAKGEIRIGAAKAHLGAGQLEEALHELHVAVDDWPDAIQPILLLARAQLLDRRPDRAERLFQSIVDDRLGPDSNAAAMVGAFFLSFNDFARAESWAKKVPDPLLKAYSMSAILAHLDRFAEAEDWARKAVDLAPGDPRSHYILGSAIRTPSHRLPEAEAEFRKSLDLDPDYLPAHMGLGIVFCVNGNRAQGIARFREIIERDPGYLTAHFELGRALLLANRPEDAREALEAALQIYPADPELHTALGYALMRLARYEEAVRQHQFALRVCPESHGALIHLAITFARQGRVREALEKYTAAIRVDPDSNNLYRDLNDLFLGKVSADISSEVSDLIHVLEERIPSPGEKDSPLGALSTLALAHLQRKTPEGLESALKWSNEGVERSESRHPDLLLVRARVLLDHGDESAAREDLERASALVYSSLGALEREESETGVFPAPTVLNHSAYWHARLLRESGDAPRAEELLYGLLEADPNRSSNLWNLWLEISFVDLKRSPAAVLDRLSGSQGGGRGGEKDGLAGWSYLEEVKRLLTHLAAHEVFRLSWKADEERAEDRLRLGHAVSFVHSVPRISYQIPLPPGDYRIAIRLVVSEASKREGEESLEIMIEGKPHKVAPVEGKREFSVETTCLVADGILDIDVGDDAATGPVVNALEIERKA